MKHQPFAARTALCRAAVAFLALSAFSSPVHAQRATPELSSEIATPAELAELQAVFEAFAEQQRHEYDVLRRQIDDLMFFLRLSHIAQVDMVVFNSAPPRWAGSDASTVFPTGEVGPGDSLRVPAYVFIPRHIDRTQKHPLIVFPHGGVHSNFGSGSSNRLREMVQQGYTVIAPEYRGSTGFGGAWFRQIDYGGLEVEDSYHASRFALQQYPFLDENRVGIVGWSHGGHHALHNIFRYPEAFAVAYAGVPVSDLVARMGYKSQRYRDYFSADYHIGATAEEDVNEYRRRSPSWLTHLYDGTPLMISTTTNDDDVDVLEVERLIEALKANGKEGFHYTIFQNAPGGHGFGGRDGEFALEHRRNIYEFLARHLQPANPMAYDPLGN